MSDREDDEEEEDEEENFSHGRSSTDISGVAFYKVIFRFEEFGAVLSWLQMR